MRTDLAIFLCVTALIVFLADALERDELFLVSPASNVILRATFRCGAVPSRSIESRWCFRTGV